MATTILILCFSAAVIALVTVVLIHSQKESAATNQRVMDQMETMTRSNATTIQSVSSDMVDSVVKTQAESHQLIMDLFLGREEQIQVQQNYEQNEQEKRPVPGIDTLEGLPTSVQEAILRDSEEQRVREWQTVLPPLSNEYENSHGSLLPDPNPSPQ
jgi:FtsZ-interacting cell division protein ZipA